MLEYKRFDISEGIDVNKTKLSKECDICHYWYFKDIGFKNEPYLCNGCHDLIQKVKENAKMLTEFIFGIWVKMMQLTQLLVLIWLIKDVFYKIFFIIYKNEWEYYLNLLSKKQRCDIKQS